MMDVRQDRAAGVTVGLDVERLARALEFHYRKNYVTVHISGHDIFETLTMPVVPRKGDILALNSLTMGRCKVPDVVVVGVEWTRNQVGWATNDNEGIAAWVYVHRVQRTRLRGVYRREEQP